MKNTYLINFSDGEQWEVTKEGFDWFKQMDSMLASLWRSVMVSSKINAHYWAVQGE